VPIISEPKMDKHAMEPSVQTLRQAAGEAPRKYRGKQGCQQWETLPAHTLQPEEKQYASNVASELADLASAEKNFALLPQQGRMPEHSEQSLTRTIQKER
jgi:hypothetical protein